MLTLRLMPDRLKRVLIVCITKATGGFRPLSLFEEMLKVVEGAVARRLTTRRNEMGMGKVLSETNSAYDK